MIQNTKLLYTSGIIVVILIMVVGIFIVTCKQTADVTEDFAVSSNNASSRSLNVSKSNKPLPKRQCAVYFTKNVEECNDAVNNWYTRPIVSLEMELRALNGKKNPSVKEQARVETIKKVLKERNNTQAGKLPFGACKVELPGWEEHIKSDSGEMVPYKNNADPNIANRGSPVDWAFCFKPADSSSKAVNAAKTFADERVVKSFDRSGDYFNDGKVYGKIAFSSLTIDEKNTNGTLAGFVCSKPAVNVPNLPKLVLVFNLAKNCAVKNAYQFEGANKICDFSVREYKNNKYVKIANPLNKVRNMFAKTQVYRNNLYVVPLTITGTMNQLSFDICGRINKKLAKTGDFAMSFANDPEIQPKFIYAFTPDVAAGTLEQLKKRLKDLNVQIGQIQPTNTPVSSVSSSSYLSGYKRSIYLLSHNTNNPVPNENISVQFDAVWYNTQLFRTTTLQPNNFMFDFGDISEIASMNNTFAIWVFEGYIKSLSDGEYYFNIDDSGVADLYISQDGNTMKYVSEQIFEARGQRGNLPVTMKKGRYYQFRLRILLVGRHPGVKIEITDRDQKPVDPSMFQIVYDNTITQTDTSSINQNDTQKQELKNQRNALVNAISEIEADVDNYISSMISKLSQRTLPVDYLNYVSLDGNLYVDVSMKVDAPPPQGWQPMYTVIREPVMDVTKTTIDVESPVTNYQTPVTYSISFWLYITGPVSTVTNLLFHGVNDNWTSTQTGDRTPGIWILPGTTKLAIRQKSNATIDDGIDSAKDLPLGRWVYIVVTVNGTSENINGQPPRSIQLYFNGVKQMAQSNNQNFKQLGPNNAWLWGVQNNKRMRLGYGNRGVNSSVYMQKVYWYDHVMSATEINDLYNNGGILKNRHKECRKVQTPWLNADDYKTNMLNNHNVKCGSGEGLTSLKYEFKDDQARINYQCCKIATDTDIVYKSVNKQTPTTPYRGDPVSLSNLTVDCATGSIQGYTLSAKPDKNTMAYNYSCMDMSSPAFAIPRACKEFKTPAINMNGTLKPFNNVELKCNDSQLLSRIQFDANKKQYNYQCCDYGGLPFIP